MFLTQPATTTATTTATHTHGYRTGIQYLSHILFLLFALLVFD